MEDKSCENDRKKGKSSEARKGSAGCNIDLLLASLSAEDYTPSVIRMVLQFWVSNGRSDLVGINPRDYDDYKTFSRDYFLLGLLKKYEAFPGGQEIRDKQALKVFDRAQMQCFGTNCSIRNRGHLGHDLGGVTSGTVFEKARSLIFNVLGPLDAAALTTIMASADHGPGSTPRVRRKEACPAVKFRGTPEATVRCKMLMADLVRGMYKPFWCGYIKTVSAGKQTAVPKNAKTSRLITSEPDINMFVQKGVGAYLKRRLRAKAKVGPKKLCHELGISETIDLTTQVHNQRLAHLSSFYGEPLELATIDLSMASDTLSYELVRYLLPDDWFSFLDHLRTADVERIDGGRSHLEMFSTMGNGFTFELESMIFWALTRALTDLRGLRSPSLVFGDDIIADSILVKDGSLPLLLALSGFSLNLEKSYWDGRFRESCGKHYFDGREVTPLYITEDLGTTAKLLVACNNLRRWSVGWGSRYFRDTSVIQAYRSLVQKLPRHLQVPRIADGYGDGALVGQFHEVLPRKADLYWRRSKKDGKIQYPYNGHEGWICKARVPVIEQDRVDWRSVLTASLHSLERRPRMRINTLPPWIGQTCDLVRRTLLCAELEQLSPCSPLTDAEQLRPVEVGYRMTTVICRQFPRV